MWLFGFRFKDFGINFNSSYLSLQALLNQFLFLIFLFFTQLSLCFLRFLKSFPAVLNVSSTLHSKFSISRFIFSILFVCNSLKSFHLMLHNSFSNVSVYNFFCLLFNINLCGLSCSVQFEVFVSSMRVGYQQYRYLKLLRQFFFYKRYFQHLKYKQKHIK